MTPIDYDEIGFRLYSGFVRCGTWFLDGAGQDKEPLNVTSHIDRR
ncbi:MAG: hypothetical protein R6X27_10745 [Candidatus Desulfacyla sp.]